MEKIRETKILLLPVAVVVAAEGVVAAVVVHDEHADFRIRC